MTLSEHSLTTIVPSNKFYPPHIDESHTRSSDSGKQRVFQSGIPFKSTKSAICPTVFA